MVRLLLSLFLPSCLAADDLQMAGRNIPPHMTVDGPKGTRRLTETSSHFFQHGHHKEQERKSPPGLASLDAWVPDDQKHHVHVRDVMIQWKDVPRQEITKHDWIGAFDRSLMTQFHAPVKYRYVFNKEQRDAGNVSSLPDHGSMTFQVWNLRSAYVFIYVSGNMQYPDLIAQSDVMTFPSVSHPQMPHLALNPNDPHKMMVMWTQKNPPKPVLKWGYGPDDMKHEVKAWSDSYSRKDFCDRGISPAGRQGFFEPGLFCTAEMPIQPGKTYYYTVGDADEGFLDAQNFTAPPAHDSESTRLILFADMGNAPADGSLQHSWDFNNHGELPSRNTTRLMKHILDKDNAHAVVHFGDLAYAVGFLSEWDEFMLQIQPVASRIPWMASIGNHEMGWSQSNLVMNGTLRTASDSGGECGVPFLKRFPFAMQPLRKKQHWRDADTWYSFDIGSVHFTMCSSEHDFTTNSPQWQWMVNDLKNVDRSNTPWLVVTFHRGMYIASDYDGDWNVAKLLRDHVEAELLKYKVDIFLAGHHHSYQRFCKLNNGTCVDDKKDMHGIVHFIVGHAGYDHSPVCKTSPDGVHLQFSDDAVWGATYWDFNQTTASMKMMDGATEKVIDSATFHKSNAVTASSIIV